MPFCPNPWTAKFCCKPSRKRWLDSADPAQARASAALRLTFPIVVTPYGIAALIALLASTGEGTQVELILAILVGVMVLNLLAMIFVRTLMHGVTLFVLQLLGAVLGVLQVALAVEIILRALGRLGMIDA